MPNPRSSFSATGRLTNRKKIATALLAERLGLEEEWKDPDSIVLPSTLPQSEVRKMSRGEVIELEGWLDELTRLGCQKRVLYWCLQQLGPTADRRRAEGTLRSIGNDEDEALNIECPRPHIATKEDLEGLVATVHKAAGLIFRYRSELQLAARALRDKHPLPPGLFTNEPLDTIEAIPLLLNYLEWVKGLAEGWEAPLVMTDVKSTGVLYLLLLVWIHTKKSPKPKLKQDRKKPSRKIKLYRLDSQIMMTIASIVDSYCGKKPSRRGKKPSRGGKKTSPGGKKPSRDDGTVAAEYLNERLHDFHENNSGLFNRMVELLEALDKAASAQ